MWVIFIDIAVLEIKTEKLKKYLLIILKIITHINVNKIASLDENTLQRKSKFSEKNSVVLHICESL